MEFRVGAEKREDEALRRCYMQGNIRTTRRDDRFGYEARMSR